MAALPVTIITAMVSPMTRPMPSMTAATMPGRAARATMRQVVCHWVAPMAMAASRYWRGTAVMASSAMETMVGMAMKARVTDPVRAVSPVGMWKTFLIQGPRVIMPMKPMTTEGMAASSSMPAFRTSLSRRGAISAMYRAAAMPMGTEMAAAPSVTSSEPRISGRMPKRGGSEMGYQLLPKRKSITLSPRKRENPSRSRNRKISRTKTTENMPLSRMAFSMNHSFSLRRRMDFIACYLLVHRHEIDLGHDLLPFRR